jgi:hypothetical protein
MDSGLAEKGTRSWKEGGVKLEKESVLRGLFTLNTLPPSLLSPSERSSPHVASVFADLPGYPKTGRHEHRAAMRSLQVRALTITLTLP